MPLEFSSLSLFCSTVAMDRFCPMLKEAAFSHPILEKFLPKWCEAIRISPFPIVSSFPLYCFQRNPHQQSVVPPVLLTGPPRQNLQDLGPHRPGTKQFGFIGLGEHPQETPKPPKKSASKTHTKTCPFTNPLRVDTFDIFWHIATWVAGCAWKSSEKLRNEQLELRTLVFSLQPVKSKIHQFWIYKTLLCLGLTMANR